MDMDKDMGRGAIQEDNQKWTDRLARTVNEDEKASIRKRITYLNSLLTYSARSTMGLNYPDSLNRSLRGNLLYQMITNRNTATLTPENRAKWGEILGKIEAGDGVLATDILNDINNNFVHRRNEVRMEALARINGIPLEQMKDFFKNVEVQALKGLSEFEKVCAANHVVWQGAFYRYFKGNYWSNPKTQVGAWEKDLDEKLANKKGGESAAVNVLSKILSSGPGNTAFVEALKNDEHPEHDNAREVLKEFIREFKRRTEQAQQDLKNQIDYEEGMYDKGNTVMERVHKIGGHVFDNIFGSGVRPEVRFIYGFMAYIVLSKGISGKGWLGKFVRGTGAALGIGMIYENVTGKPALAFLGIDSPAESSRGSWIHKEDKNSGI